MPELRQAITEALGPRYRVEREVRPVGECRLFVAVDPAGEAQLLVKVLPTTLSMSVDDAAFERAILLLASALRHDRLVPPRGAGRARAHIYHTRPFVAGTTLRAWMGHNGPVPLRRAVEILTAVLSGLAHAHAAQLAHGEVIPENVVLTDDGALVVDTGVRGAVGRCLRAGSLPECSAEGDMRAVGALVYEMLTGRQPPPDPEKFEETRALPAWVPDLLSHRWADAGEALAAIQPSHL